jgi:hypothetical protein
MPGWAVALVRLQDTAAGLPLGPKGAMAPRPVRVLTEGLQVLMTLGRRPDLVARHLGAVAVDFLAGA